jgi:hypothetical protein
VSNFLAVATVSAALRQVISDAVTADVPSAETKVTHVRPGGENPGTPATGVNVYLYAVTPNGALRNADLPSRRGDGTPIRRPEAAIDLHYLLTFYGDDTALETQRLLGSVVRTLHGAPTIPRRKLREAASALDWLEGSDIPDAPQAVRLTPVELSLEQLSKLWSILLQTPYALSAAYRASVGDRVGSRPAFCHRQGEHGMEEGHRVADRLRRRAACEHRPAQSLDVLGRDCFDPPLPEPGLDVDPLHRLAVLSIGKRAPSIRSRSRNASATSLTVWRRSSAARGNGRRSSASTSLRAARSAWVRVRP